MDKVGDTGEESDGETDGEKSIERKAKCVEKSNEECVCVGERERGERGGREEREEGGRRERREEREERGGRGGRDRKRERETERQRERESLAWPISSQEPAFPHAVKGVA